MGCSPPEGKRAQHNARPFTVTIRCSRCGICADVCPKTAITIEKIRSVIDRDLCIGCFECMHVCPEHAIDIDSKTGIPVFMERMIGHAYSAVKAKQG